MVNIDSTEPDGNTSSAESFNRAFHECAFTLDMDGNKKEGESKLYELVHTHMSRIITQGRRYKYLKAADKEDIVQSAVIQIMNSLRDHGYSRIEHPNAYVEMSIYHAMVSHTRLQKHQPVAFGHTERYGDLENSATNRLFSTVRDYRDYKSGYLGDLLAEKMFEPDELLMLADAIEKVNKTVSGGAIMLNSFYLCNPRKSYKELTEELGCVEGTVKSRMNRAKTRLEQTISDFQKSLDPSKVSTATGLLNKLAAIETQRLYITDAMQPPCR